MEPEKARLIDVKSLKNKIESMKIVKNVRKIQSSLKNNEDTTKI